MYIPPAPHLSPAQPSSHFGRVNGRRQTSGRRLSGGPEMKRYKDPNMLAGAANRYEGPQSG